MPCAGHLKLAVLNTLATGNFLQRRSHQYWLSKAVSFSPTPTPTLLWNFGAMKHLGRKGGPPGSSLLPCNGEIPPHAASWGKSQPANRDFNSGAVLCDVPSLLTNPPPQPAPSPPHTTISTPRLNKLYHLPPGSLAVAEPRRHRGWWVSSSHRGRSPLKSQLCPWQFNSVYSWHCSWWATFWATFSPWRFFSWFLLGQVPLQHYSLSIARDCFLEFLSRRKCVFLRNRCSSLKPNFMWGLKYETKIITLKSGSWEASPSHEECFL